MKLGSESPDTVPVSIASEPPEAGAPLPIDDDQLLSRPLRVATGGRWQYLAVAVLGLVIFFPNLGGFGLWDPWETHYGEVTRNMIETRDWVSPKWGYEGRAVGAPPAETGPFLSKPILIFWSEVLSIRTFGYSEWAFRFPMALLGFLVMLMTYRTVRRCTTDGRAGLLAALVVATSPQFFLLSRQAQTDMPFVGTMTLGVFFLMLAMYRPRTRISDRAFWVQLTVTALVLGLLIFPQLAVIATDVDLSVPGSVQGGRRLMLTLWRHGIWHAVGWTLLALPVLASILWPIIRERRRSGRLDEAFKDLWSRRLHLYLFYAFIALATLAKGLLGFLLPGAIVFVYLLVTWNWRVLARLQLLRGIGVFVLVSFPWYVAMFAIHGMRYYNRFFVHDHFNRFASGVHQVDTGLFEHFIKWLGIGMFPWAALVPVALIAIFLVRRIPRSPQGRFVVFLFVWSFFSYALFTKSSTKFHHYIFPALPPLAVILGMWLRDLPRMKPRAIRLAAIVAIGFTVSIGWTVRTDVQALRNLMTYKYDRPLPKHLPVDPGGVVADGSKVTWEQSRFYKEVPSTVRVALGSTWAYHPNVTLAVGLVALLGLVLWLFATPLWVRAGTALLGTSAVLLTVWALNVYMPMLSTAWSQEYIFDEYYARCRKLPNPPEIQEVYTPLVSSMGLDFLARATGARSKQVCDEDIVAWLFTWRGETFYSNNEILPISKSEYMRNYLEDFNGGKPFFAVLETHRRSSFESALKRESRKLVKSGKKGFAAIREWRVRMIHAENPFFVLVYAEPLRGPGNRDGT